MSIASETNVQARGHTTTLRDGRTLAWCEYGDLSGTPVFALHGTPGSRIWSMDDDPDARTLGIRLITPERPGYGMSTPQKDRTMLGWADDIAQLADRLGFEQFAVIGGSGGAPHTLACAHALPDRVTQIMIWACPSPFEANVETPGLAFANRLGFFVSRHISPRLPWLMRTMLGQTVRAVEKDPSVLIDQIKPQLCKADQEAIEDPEYREIALAMTAEAYRSGIEGHFGDLTVTARPWGFDPADVQTPTHLWHGEADTLVPVPMGRYMADVLPNVTAHFLPGKGHLLDHGEGQWRAMLEPLGR